MVVKSVDVAPSMQQHQALAGIGPCKHPHPQNPMLNELQKHPPCVCCCRAFDRASKAKPNIGLIAT